MKQMILYKAEIEAGLSDKILSNNSVNFCSKAELTNTFPISNKTLAHLSKASIKDGDLHYLKSILCTTGWNKNDEVFLPLETWVSRNTAEDKPLNYEHDCGNIVGHITDGQPVDFDFKPINQSLSAEEIPSDFHILTGSVLYKFWDKPELQERMDKILAEIPKDLWFVSLEAIFSSFDYAMKSDSGEQKIISRNEKTAFLTKHLRAYGGTGKYDGYRIGRILRNFTFCGKGLVRNPANPNSIIIKEEVEKFVANSENYLIANVEDSKTQVYLNSNNVIKSENVQTLTKLSEIEVEKTELDKKIAELETENKKLKAELQETNVKELQSKVAKLEADKAKADELLTKASDALKLSQTELAKVQNSVLELTKVKDSVESELKTIKAEKKEIERLGEVKTKLKCDEEKAKAFVAKFVNLDDATFNSAIEAVLSVKPETKVETVKVDATVLEKAEVKVEPAMNTQACDTNKKVAADIANYLKKN